MWADGLIQSHGRLIMNHRNVVQGSLTGSGWQSNAHINHGLSTLFFVLDAKYILSKYQGIAGVSQMESTHRRGIYIPT